MATERLTRVAATAGLAVVLLAAIGVQAVAVAASWGLRYWLPGGAAAVVVGVLALVRHRQRVVTATAGLAVAGSAVAAARLFDLPTEPGPALALASAVLVGSAVRALPPLPAGLIAAGGLVVAAGAWAAARPGAGGSGVVALDGLCWLGGVVAGLTLRLLDERARAAAERVRRDERLELARELHDVVAHHVTGMVVQAQAAHLVGRRDPARATESLAGIEAAGGEALRAMRRLVGVLRDTADAPPASAGTEQIEELVERFRRQGPPVRLRLPGETAWPPEVTSTVHRIVREALTNVARHAPHAGQVTVDVSQEPDAVVVEVTDDASGVSAVSAEQRGGYGLIGLRERVEALGGTLRAGPRSGAGWSVRAVVPHGRA
ncbi:sensor histidine kinase [Micromonospora aurantiaca (nom. illeg.)]|uniref:sensor histidine kinase n=1 Tax=Micromonospora aurantiaca (nom. illeg.) TaxID=47850 RepID=UPI00367B69F0